MGKILIRGPPPDLTGEKRGGIKHFVRILNPKTQRKVHGRKREGGGLLP